MKSGTPTLTGEHALFALCVGLLCLAAAQSGDGQIPGSKGYLLVTSFDNPSVFLYDAAMSVME